MKPHRPLETQASPHNRPDVFRLHVDTTPRRAVVVESFALPVPEPEPEAIPARR